MKLEIKADNKYFHLDWGNISAQVSTSNICIGHLGCKLLSTLEKIPQDLKNQWEKKIGKHIVSHHPPKMWTRF